MMMGDYLRGFVCKLSCCKCLGRVTLKLFRKLILVFKVDQAGKQSFFPKMHRNNKTGFSGVSNDLAGSKHRHI